MHYLPIFSTLVSAVFAIAVFERYRRRRGTHLLLWSIGLVLYGLGTLTEAVMAFTFSPVAIKLWYLSGAMLTAAWLGQGTVHLLIRKRHVASTLTVILAIVSLVALVLILLAPIESASASFDTSQPVSAQYKDILSRNTGIILLTILLNIYGSVTLIGGPIYSGYLFWRKRVLLHRVAGNVLIAVGAFMPAMAGSFIKLGITDMLYVSEFIGVVLMYAGFILSTSVQSAPALARHSPATK